MLENALFIRNNNIKVDDRDTWRNMGFNEKSKVLPDKGGIPCFHKEFTACGKIKFAKVTATALGIFDMFLNGERIGDRKNTRAVFDELKPGWTDYNTRVFAFEYDITDMIIHGVNSFTAEVSCGWYSCRISFGAYGYLPPAFCCEIKLEYESGETELIHTDSTWETAVKGPVMTADIWDGEYFDARVKRDECEAWEKPESFRYEGIIVPAMQPRIIVKPELERKPQSAVLYEGTKPNGTRFGEINRLSEKTGDDCEVCILKCGQRLLLDMGQNMVGRPHIKIKASAGTKITFYFAELLNDSGDENRGNDDAKGSAYVKNYRSALSRFVYIASGTGIEEYSARHTFFGFRYLEIETSAPVEILGIRGEVVGSDNKETCSFECSNEEVNKLWSNIVWGQRGNYISIPTDCPQRDERLGWTGDTQIFCGAGSYIADIYEFMRKWLQDARDTQNADGSYGDVIPKVFKNPAFVGNAAWTDACIIVPYIMYLKYGKKQIIEEHFASMERYMDYVSGFGLEGANTAYGDWLCYEKTDKRYIAVCYFAYTASIMKKCAHILNKPDREKYYGELFLKIKQHFQDRYLTKDGITEETQTGYLLALKFDLIPENMRSREIAKLREKIESNDYTLSTGFVGTGLLCTTLSELSLHDLCYSLLLQTKDPSWLYSVRQGATTVWERWNSYTLENGFGDVNMNSFNHYAYGAVAEWLIGYMAGIRVSDENAGFSKVIISPKIDNRAFIPKGQDKITYAKARYDSVRGSIESEWHINGEACEYNIVVPCDATVELETKGKVTLTADGDITEIAPEADLTTLKVTAGSHRIIVK